MSQWISISMRVFMFIFSGRKSVKKFLHIFFPRLPKIQEDNRSGCAAKVGVSKSEYARAWREGSS